MIKNKSVPFYFIIVHTKVKMIMSNGQKGNNPNIISQCHPHSNGSVNDHFKWESVLNFRLFIVLASTKCQRLKMLKTNLGLETGLSRLTATPLTENPCGDSQPSANPVSGI